MADTYNSDDTYNADEPYEGTGAALDVWVEGMTETISVNRWSITFNTSPVVDLLPSGYWVLGTSTLGTGTILAY